MLSDVNELLIAKGQFVECVTKGEMSELISVVLSNSGIPFSAADYSGGGFVIEALDGKVHISAMRGNLSAWDDAETSAVRLRVTIDGHPISEPKERQICAALVLGKAFSAMQRGKKVFVYEHLFILAGGVSAENLFKCVETFWAGVIRSMQSDHGML